VIRQKKVEEAEAAADKISHSSSSLLTATEKHQKPKNKTKQDKKLA